MKATAPKKRGRLRKFLGKKFFILKRLIVWAKHKKTYADKKSETLLPYQVFSHSSTLLRKLKDVEMQYQYNKITNLRIAISKLNKVIIHPGETFSLWYLVGAPSKRNGFLKGLVLNNGKIGYDYGGGLCQLGNLLYWISLHSPLSIIERWRHGYDVFPDVGRKLPFGSGATLSYNYIDLQLKNNTDQDYQFNLFLTDEKLCGELYSNKKQLVTYEVYEDFHQIQHEVWGGYTRHNRINRKTFDLERKEQTDELITENHAIMMYEPFLPETTTTHSSKTNS